MKKVALVLCALLSLAVSAATVSNVRSRQRYPWNGLVDIDYTLDGDTSGLNVLITVTDRATGKKYTPKSFFGLVPSTAGTHRVTWSPTADGITCISTNMVTSVALVRSRVPESGPANGLYMVIDISGGASASNYPVTYLSAPPQEGWTAEYKTNKLVLRRIEAGSFMEYGTRSTTLTKPFYIGVFEVTQTQYYRVMGNNLSNSQGSQRPVEMVSWNVIRGDSATYNYPSNKSVDPTSFMGRLRAKTGLDGFDLPTEARWEYACRAGTTSSFNNGGSTEADLKVLGRYSGNTSDGRGGYAQHTVVGSYLPNAWGLYDMHGNVFEWCLDWSSSITSVAATDPEGPVSGPARVVRGGAYGSLYSVCVSSYRGVCTPSMTTNHMCGFRLCCEVQAQ